MQRDVYDLVALSFDVTHEYIKPWRGISIVDDGFMLSTMINHRRCSNVSISAASLGKIDEAALCRRGNA